VIDATPYHFEENREQQLSERRIGLGTMGLADMLIKLGVRYGSPESLRVVEDVYSTIAHEAYRTSVELAQEKGSFPEFETEKHLQGDFIQRLPRDIREGISRHGIRNVTLTTQAPTGSTSLLAGASSGIEPIFALKYVRKDRIGTHEVLHPLAEEWLEEHEGEGLGDLPDYFVTASDLTAMDHVRMQALIQKYTDSSISKTVNAPRDQSIEETARVYMKAYDSGCKGITYFREGSREAVLTKSESEDDAEKDEAAEKEKTAKELAFGEISPIKRPASLEGITHRKATPVGNLYLTLNVREGHPFELFAQIGKAGSDVSGFTEAIARLVSLAFRCGIDPHEVAGELTGIGGSRSVGFGSNRVRSVPDAIGQFLVEYLRGMEIQEEEEPGQLSVEDLAAAVSEDAAAGSNNDRQLSFNLCPNCGIHALIYEEGCCKCMACGYSEC
jgi:ribonucleoside-diphosphate reductase alpha chain